MRKWILAGLAGVMMTASAMATEREQFIDLFLSPRLIHANMRAEIAFSAANTVLAYNGFSWLGAKTAEPATFTDRDLKRIIQEIDRISATYASAVDPDQPEALRLVVDKFKGDIEAEWADFYRPGSEHNQLAVDNRSFLISAALLPIYRELLAKLAPDTIGPYPFPDTIGLYPFVPRNTTNELYGPLALDFTQPNRLEIHSVLSGRAVELIANGNQLRQQEQQLRDRGQAFGARNKYRYILQLWDNWFYDVSSGVRRQWIDVMRTRIDVEKAKSEIAMLGKRVQMLADPYKTGLCYAMGLDDESLRASQGDWTRVRTRANKSLNNSSYEVKWVVEAYAQGCYVKQDFSMARSILERWAEAHHDQGKLTEYTHCKLALWTRHGVGGKRDSKLADQWERRAYEQAEVTCQHPPESLIDPRDPWADLH